MRGPKPLTPEEIEHIRHDLRKYPGRQALHEPITYARRLLATLDAERAARPDGLREWLDHERYVHAKVNGIDPANGKPSHKCATCEQAWPCLPVQIVDHVLEALASPAPALDSPMCVHPIENRYCRNGSDYCDLCGARWDHGDPDPSPDARPDRLREAELAGRNVEEALGSEIEALVEDYPFDPRITALGRAWAALAGKEPTP